MSPGSLQRSSVDGHQPPRRFHDLEDVVLLCDFPDKGLKSGDAGTIVHVFDTTDEAYYVEFVNDDGSARAMVAVKADQIRLEAP